jgi:CheY-like chemotaxis protein
MVTPMTRILIAEDERDIRDLIEFTLTFGGHEVIAARNGVEAVDLAPHEKPDLILLDVRMPRMTGYEACRAIKALDGLKDIPVVFLSAKGQQDEMESGMEAGAYDYILKPFAPDHLNTRVNEILVRAKTT